MSRVAELQYHGLTTGRADGPQQTGITLDLRNNNVVCEVVHYELHSSLGERKGMRLSYFDTFHQSNKMN